MCGGGECSWAELELVDTQTGDGCLWGNDAAAAPLDRDGKVTVVVVQVVVEVVADDRKERGGDWKPEKRDAEEARLALSESRMGVSTPEEN